MQGYPWFKMGGLGVSRGEGNAITGQKWHFGMRFVDREARLNEPRGACRAPSNCRNCHPTLRPASQLGSLKDIAGITQRW